MFGNSGPATAAEDPAVLVIDDTDAVRQVVCAGLRHHGFEVRAAGNGRDAIELYYELFEQDRDVAVLLDVQMPGLDGPLVLAALQTLDPGVRAYFMTGDPGRYGEDELLATGAHQVFAKPLDIALVVAELRRGLPAGKPKEPAIARPPAPAGPAPKEEVRWLPSNGPPGPNTAAGSRPSGR